MLRTRIAAVVAAGSVAAGLTACGDDSGSTSASGSTVTSTETVTSETTGSEGTSTEATTPEETTRDGGDGDAPPADVTVTKLTGFSSPSGNIGCYIDRKNVRCDIQDRDWEPPPAPADCQLDYGQGISMSAGAAPEFVCAGDTALGAGDPLPYGQSIAAGLLRCESEESGMTCRDVESGRGFTLSMETYDIF